MGGFASLVFAEKDTNFSSSYLFEFWALLPFKSAWTVQLTLCSAAVWSLISIFFARSWSCQTRVLQLLSRVLLLHWLPWQHCPLAESLCHLGRKPWTWTHMACAKSVAQCMLKQRQKIRTQLQCQCFACGVHCSYGNCSQSCTIHL